MGSNQSFAGLSLNVRSTPTHQRQRPVFSARNRSSAVFSAPVDGCSGGLVSCSASGRSSGQKCPMLIPLTLHSAHRFAPQNAPETAPVPVTDWKSLLASSEGKDSYHPSHALPYFQLTRDCPGILACFPTLGLRDFRQRREHEQESGQFQTAVSVCSSGGTSLANTEKLWLTASRTARAGLTMQPARLT